ncbi:alpha/beta fold hydrolase [Nonomuraea rhodomycinica]|uniref:Alpha/beta hydrolase n=1 Tax=Nonomuraea rhodomycinica TaxID=1712872 RepID=A0A7Y6MH72_9ACTN|nr:alpha/beta hydrolase [Nonomuraea rhodomycinica]NUW46426.1 alpha/beta hydrolase [Nonomuraea rhodomycinica]
MNYGVREPERLGRVTLRDGRGLGWAEWGPADGTPVLFFPGAATGRSLGFGADDLARLGVRLVSVDRPGLGASDPDPERTLLTWADDVRDLVGGLGMTGGAAVVGFSHGAPFALACAAAGVVTAASVVSGLDELTHPELAGLLDPGVAGLVRAAGEDPDGLEAAMTRDAGAEMMWRLVTELSHPSDVAVYTDPAFAPAYRRALEEGFAQGAAGYARDLVLAYRPWPFAVESIAVPVELWYGGHDPGTVHSPDHGAVLSRRIPGSRLRVLPDEGGSLLWTRSADVLEGLLEVSRAAG